MTQARSFSQLPGSTTIDTKDQVNHLTADKCFEKILLLHLILKVIHLLLAKYLLYLPLLCQYLKTTTENSPNPLQQRRLLQKNALWQSLNLQH